MPNDIPDWTGQQLVELVGVRGQILGDTGLPALNADAWQEAGSLSPLTSRGLGAAASFKALAASVIALVGAVGAPTVGTNVAVTPPFGQATVAGHLLLAWVTCDHAISASVSAGWVKVVEKAAVSSFASIWAKPNCGAGEAAPTFTSTAGGDLMHAQAAEFSGVALAAPADQTSTAAVNPGATLSGVAASADTAAGDLLAVATRWSAGDAVVPSFSDTYNNSAVPIVAGTTHSDTSGFHMTSNFTFGIIPPATSALPLGVANWDYDAQAVSAPAVGSVATLTLAGVAGKVYRVAMIDAAVEATTAAVAGSFVQVLDGATVIYQSILTTTGVIGALAQLGRTDLALKGTAGNSVTLKFTAAQVGAQETVSIGVYLR